MKSLLELVRIVSKNKVQHIEVLGTSTAKSSKVMHLYEAIHAGKVKTDEEAVKHLYGPNYNYPSYCKLKRSLKKRLFNSLLFVNLSCPSLNEQEKAYYLCHKDWAVVRVLLRLGARQAAISLAKKTLKLALRFDLTEIVVQASQVLRFHYGTRIGNLKMMEKYGQIHRQYAAAWQSESLAEEYYARLVAKYINERAAKAEAGPQALAYYECLKDSMEAFPTYRLLFLGHLIRIIAYRSVNDYRMTIESCEAAIRAFESKDYDVKTPIYTFLHQQILAHIQLRQFGKGEHTALKAEQLIPTGTVNWFVNMELLLLLSLHTRQYQRAYDIYQKAARHREFRRLREVDKEQWRIHKAYIHFLVEIGRARPEQQLRKFRLGRFLNEVPVFSQDKHGMNVAILIIQILFLIVKKRYKEAINRIDAINKYRMRYLYRNKALKRSNYFVKMLIQIPQCSFHKAGVLRRSEKCYKQLKAIPLEVAHQTHGIEIIPYEDLWEFVLETLDMQFHTPRR